MASAYFVLATGRTLVEASESVDLVIDDALLRESEVLAEPYTLRSVGRTCDPAVALPALLTHGELFERLHARDVPEAPMWQALSSLMTGRPLHVKGVSAQDLLSLVYAA